MKVFDEVIMKTLLFACVSYLSLTVAGFCYPPLKSEGQLRMEERSRTTIEKRKALIAWADGKRSANTEQTTLQKPSVPEVKSATAKIVEDPDYGDMVKISWKAIVSNPSPENWRLMVKIEFIDADGFILDNATKYDVFLNPTNITVVSDYKYLDRKLWKSVRELKGSIEHY